MKRRTSPRFGSWMPLPVTKRPTPTMAPTAARKNDLGSQRLFHADSIIGVKIMVKLINSPALVAEVIFNPNVSSVMIADWVRPNIVPSNTSVFENLLRRINQIAIMARVAIPNRTESMAGTVAKGVIALAAR
jgi:hypothetical protein